jgi:hypothetical protein
VRAKRVISVCFVLLGLLSSGYFLNDGWHDEPKAPEKDSLVVEETETTQEFREEGRVNVVTVAETKKNKSHFDQLQQEFSSALAARFNCYKVKIHCEDPPDDVRVAIASFII